MDYRQALDFIHSTRWLGPKRPLSDTRKMLDDLGAPDRSFKAVHITGTNGKGSTSAYIESVLRKAGYRTGMFTSPYITRFNERIRVNGEDIPDDDLAELTTELCDYIEAQGIKPKEFEIVTVLGFMYFAKCGCDVAVIEVGMGGEKDYTNVIDPPEVSVITAVGLDHTKQLGSTLGEIARTKSGIIKRGSSAVCFNSGEEVTREIENRCRAVGAELQIISGDDVKITSMDIDGAVFDFGEYRGLYTPLAGVYQPYNCALAAAVCGKLAERGFNITKEDIYDGFRETKWKGRFEKLRDKPVFILDGAHNPPAISGAVESLKRYFGQEKIVFVMDIMADKDVESVLRQLIPMAKRFVTIPIDYPRAMTPKALKELIESMGGEAEDAETVSAGVRRGIELAGDNGVVCALGSLYLSQSVREAVQEISESDI